jgi:hypothetical protein
MDIVEDRYYENLAIYAFVFVADVRNFKKNYSSGGYDTASKNCHFGHI